MYTAFRWISAVKTAKTVIAVDVLTDFLLVRLYGNIHVILEKIFGKILSEVLLFRRPLNNAWFCLK